MSKLLFLWIDTSKNKFIQKKGFNLGGEFFYEYDEREHKLTRQKKSGYLKNFWGNGINELVVIAGVNGSGKTTLLQEIFENHKEKSIYIFEKDSKLYYFQNLGYDLNIEFDGIEKSMSFNDWKTIYVSNSMEKRILDIEYCEKQIYKFALTDAAISAKGRKIIKQFVFFEDINEVSDNETGYKLHKMNRLARMEEISGYENIDNIIKIYFLVNRSLQIFEMGKKEKIILNFEYPEVVMQEERHYVESFTWKMGNQLTNKGKNIWEKLVIIFFIELEYFCDNQINGGVRNIEIKDFERIKTLIEEYFDENKKKVWNETILFECSRYFIEAKAG